VRNREKRKCVTCKKPYWTKVYNQMNCTITCRKKYKAEYYKLHRLLNINRYLERARAYAKKHYRKIKAAQRMDYLRSRERGALWRMYGTAKVLYRQRLKCAITRIKRRPEQFTKAERLKVRGGKLSIAYKRVRAMSKTQIKSTKGNWED